MQETVNQDRDKYIGGSDIPIIMNMSPYKSRFDLLLEKAGLKDDDFEGNQFTEYGNTMEPKIREFMRSHHGVDYVEGMHIYDDIRIHTDGEGVDDLTNIFNVLEIKTTSHIYEKVDQYMIYLVQLLFYMYMTGAEYGTLAVYERPDDFDEEFDSERLHIYDIKAVDYTDLTIKIWNAIDNFRVDLQKIKDDPFIEESALLPQDITAIAERILQFEIQLQQMKDIQKKIDQEKESLKAAMEKANVKSWETPNHYKITLVNDTPDKEATESYFDMDGFKTENPEMYHNYEKTRTVIKKGRKGYVKITAPKKGTKS
jgi:putative phage-type endonuclease